MGKLRIVLADDHQVVRQGMSALLNAQADLRVVGEAADGHELLGLVEKLQPDVALTDIAMPNLNGIEATGQIRKRFPKTQVVILSMYSASSYVVRALRNGALGFLLKNDDIGDIVEAIRRAACGCRTLSKQIEAQAIGEFVVSPPAKDDLPGQLTGREREILQLIAEGHTNAQIATKLSISVRTVESHRSNLMSKLNLTTHADVVRFAIRYGLVSLLE